MDAGPRADHRRHTGRSDDRLGDRLGGHWVSGHVDAVGRVLGVDRADGVVVRIGVPAELARFVAPKGSIALDGISLTVVDVGRDDVTADGDWCSVALIPETLARTSAGDWAPDVPCNVEVDLVARYVARLAGGD